MSTDPYSGPPPEEYRSDPGYAPGPGYGGYEPGGYGPSGPRPDRGEAASKKLAAGLCGILLGGFGVHKFILGYNNAGIIMAAVTVSTLVGGIASCGMLAPLTLPVTGVVGVIGLVEGIIYLTKSDEEFYQTYMAGKREWF